jgi:hypothetical protein
MINDFINNTKPKKMSLLTEAEHVIADVKKDVAEVKLFIADGKVIYNQIADANAGITDPAQIVTNAAKVIVANQSELPSSWQGTRLEKAVMNFCTWLETGVPESDIEIIVKDILAALSVAKSA